MNGNGKTDGDGSGDDEVTIEDVVDCSIILVRHGIHKSRKTKDMDKLKVKVKAKGNIMESIHTRSYCDSEKLFKDHVHSNFPYEDLCSSHNDGHITSLNKSGNKSAALSSTSTTADASAGARASASASTKELELVDLTMDESSDEDETGNGNESGKQNDSSNGDMDINIDGDLEDQIGDVKEDPTVMNVEIKNTEHEKEDNNENEYVIANQMKDVSMPSAHMSMGSNTEINSKDAISLASEDKSRTRIGPSKTRMCTDEPMNTSSDTDNCDGGNNQHEQELKDADSVPIPLPMQMPIQTPVHMPIQSPLNQMAHGKDENTNTNTVDVPSTNSCSNDEPSLNVDSDPACAENQFVSTVECNPDKECEKLKIKESSDGLKNSNADRSSFVVDADVMTYERDDCEALVAPNLNGSAVINKNREQISQHENHLDDRKSHNNASELGENIPSGGKNAAGKEMVGNSNAKDFQGENKDSASKSVTNANEACTQLPEMHDVSQSSSKSKVDTNPINSRCEVINPPNAVNKCSASDKINESHKARGAEQKKRDLILPNDVIEIIDESDTELDILDATTTLRGANANSASLIKGEENVKTSTAEEKGTKEQYRSNSVTCNGRKGKDSYIEILEDSDDDEIQFVGVKIPEQLRLERLKRKRQIEEDSNAEAVKFILERSRREAKKNRVKKGVNKDTHRHLKQMQQVSHSPPNWAFYSSKEVKECKPAPMQPKTRNLHWSRRKLYNFNCSESAALEEQERLFKETAARVKAQEGVQKLLQISRKSAAPQYFKEVVKDVSTLPKNHFKWSDPYSRLGVPRKSRYELVKRNYRKLCLLYHPDKIRTTESGCHDRFQGIKEAYEQITESLGI